MSIWIVWIILITGSYLIGSIPASYLAAKSRGIDLRQCGTNQVGGGNLWRMTSWKFGLPVGLFDFSKGAVMLWIAQTQGLDIAQQVIVGLAAIVGHNWPIFLHLHGGRGIGTMLGVILILPGINSMTSWPSIIAVGIVLLGFLVLRSSPLPVFLSVASLPLTHWALHDETAVALAFLAVFLIVVIKRLTAQPELKPAAISRKRVLLNRLLFDRDIMDKKMWMYRRPIEGQEPWED